MDTSRVPAALDTQRRLVRVLTLPLSSSAFELPGAVTWTRRPTDEARTETHPAVHTLVLETRSAVIAAGKGAGGSTGRFTIGETLGATDIGDSFTDEFAA
jgi:hypothetical protein